MKEIEKIAEEIIVAEQVKVADTSKLFNDLNGAFNKYISKQFPATVDGAHTKVPYEQLPPGDKEKVWQDFNNSPEAKRIFQFHKMLK
jgi:hypothetical protein